jgi:NitT/TauT family transport system substrate-binding protein
MAQFRIMPHGRLQEWVAEEKGYFKDEGLNYAFTTGRGYELLRGTGGAAVQSAEGAPVQVTRGAFESYEAGRACEVSSACHWAVNMAAAANHGLMYGHAYSVGVAAIMVPPGSPIRTVQDLAGVEVGVGYHSGSHFSALQALAPYCPVEAIKLSFLGGPLDRLDLLVAGKVPAANLFTKEMYAAEQLGCRRMLDTTFMMGFLVSAASDREEVEKYFRALRRAQRDIDAEPERYKHYYRKELPERYHTQVDVQAFGPGERIVFEPYTREVFEATHRWMVDLQLFPEEQRGQRDYAQAVLV